MEQDRKKYEKKSDMLVDEWGSRISEMRELLANQDDRKKEKFEMMLKKVDDLEKIARSRHDKLVGAEEGGWREEQLGMENAISELRKAAQQVFVEINQHYEATQNWEIRHQIFIDATPDKVYAALTTAKGLKRWWTSDVKYKAKEGEEVVFGFNDHSVVFRMRIEKLVPDQRVVWTCLGDVKEWAGTSLEFQIIQEEGERVRVKFTHSGWRSGDRMFRQCNTDWGHLMYFLKDYAEGKNDKPFMS